VHPAKPSTTTPKAAAIFPKYPWITADSMPDGASVAHTGRYDRRVPIHPAVFEVCLIAAILVWLALELRQAVRVRHEARSVDRGSVMVVRLSAVAGFAAGIGLARVLPETAFRGDAAAWVGIGVLGCGVALRAWCFHTLGRYFTITVQTSRDQPVITTGPYRVLRHPSYLGLLLGLAGVALVATRDWLATIVVVVAVGLGLAYRIRVEERALERDLGADYRAYAATHKRLVPFIW
jgi:protein-S-isoprenylcysteine O-methyltransferase Ste14